MSTNKNTHRHTNVTPDHSQCATITTSWPLLWPPLSAYMLGGDLEHFLFYLLFASLRMLITLYWAPSLSLCILFCPVVSTSLCPLPSLQHSCSRRLVFSCFLAIAYAFIVLWRCCFDPQFVFLALIFLFPSLRCFIVSALKSCFLKFITWLKFLLRLSQWSSFLGLFSVAGCFSSLLSPYRARLPPMLFLYTLFMLHVSSSVHICMPFPVTQTEGV